MSEREQRTQGQAEEVRTPRAEPPSEPTPPTVDFFASNPADAWTPIRRRAPGER